MKGRIIRVPLVAAGACVLALITAFLCPTPPSEAGNAPTKLELSDFLAAQGSADVWYPPEPALFAWTGRPPDYPRMGWIDYAGAADRWLMDNGGDSLSTEITGTFTRIAVGGQYEYSVNLHVKHALAWCVVALDGNGDWDGQTLLFGSHVDQVLGGATPALGDCEFKATWRQDQDTPLADLNLASNYGDPYRPAGYELRDIDLRATAFGPLHAAAGLGAEGTSGKMTLSQTSSNPQALGKGNGNQDGYPAEVADLQKVGK